MAGNVISQLQKVPLAEPQPHIFSSWSSPAVPYSGFASQDFLLGAGMVILQPSSNRVVVVYDSRTKEYFLPRGRKDLGESLEQTALREAYEESGYKAEHMRLFKPTHQPLSPQDPSASSNGPRLNSEPLYITVDSWAPKSRNGRVIDSGGEYFVFWYLGYIGADAVSSYTTPSFCGIYSIRQIQVHVPGTGMPDEKTFSAALYTIKDAKGLLFKNERKVLDYAWAVYAEHHRYLDTLKLIEKSKKDEKSGSKLTPSK
ncbi:uncharacterized protein BT62DRAFT_569285 [Guyanagaster necrorhizus]|uniref:Nudix hydrolase domain-containing protein n=1 Tax=Guyanagaster necrorhizus TaxID=856835 RepID=A0A9P7VHM7_9AGAR|nr:uncharacterized protein BT62DRAFT_569285 [Guyanagaster necrorhizus MCA 3950]KAG7440727.1 hypothetical protein BT62DRAFT_569285 [Guyanagaster necrorhizus MCA 3950]